MKNEIDIENMEFVEHFIAENELIETMSITKENKINHNIFSNLLFKPFGHEEYGKYLGFYIGTSILREEMGFLKGEKPGDYDVLIIPFNNEKVYFERTCAIEVKVVRPTRKNPKKAPNSYGLTQLNGLISDGFPFVGIIHICMPEPLKENEKKVIKLDLTPFDMDNPSNNKDFLNKTIDAKFDTFSWFSAENQMKRLISKEIPKYVGICTFGLNVTNKKELITWFNHDFNVQYDSGYFNPHKKETTIEMIKTYWNNNKNKFRIAEK